MGTEHIEKTLQGIADETGKAIKLIEDTGIQMKDLVAKFKTLEEWQADAEKKLADKRISLHGGDNVLAAIPEQMRNKHLPLAIQQCSAYEHGKKPEYAGHDLGTMFPKDPVLKTATAIWIANHILKLTEPAQYMARLAWHEKLEEAIGWGANEKAAMSGLSGGVGGNLIPTIVESEILRLVADNSVLRPKVRKVPMTQRVHAYPTRNAAFSAAIIAEEGSITDSVPATPFAQSSLTAKKLACFATVSAELLQDNVVMLADYLGTEFGEQIGLLEDTQALEGDGTGVNFTGVVAASGVNSVTSGANGDFLSWQKAAGAPWVARQRSSRRGAQWFCAPEVIQVLVRTRTDAAAAADAAGLPLFIPPLGGIGGAAPSTLVGFTYDEHSGLLTNRAVGTGSNRTNIYFGPPQTIIFGDLLGFSIELNPWSKFQTFQIDIRGLKRTGILVGVPSAWVKYVGIDPTGTMKA